MNQIELEKIADTFDKDRSGMIDLSEIITVLKGTNRRTRRPIVQEESLTDAQKIENEVRLSCALVTGIGCRYSLQVFGRAHYRRCFCLDCNTSLSLHL